MIFKKNKWGVHCIIRGKRPYFNIYNINLTAIFGAGNEPTQEQMDSWLADYKEYSKMENKNRVEVIGQLMEAI